MKSEEIKFITQERWKAFEATSERWGHRSTKTIYTNKTNQKMS